MIMSCLFSSCHFVLWCHLWDSRIKPSFQRIRFMSTFSSMRFIGFFFFALTFMSLIFLELILYMLRSRGFKFIFVCEYPVVPALFGDGAGLYPRNMLCHPSQKSTEVRERSWIPSFHHRRTYLPYEDAPLFRAICHGKF